jgi:hypothetical protein
MRATNEGAGHLSGFGPELSRPRGSRRLPIIRIEDAAAATRRYDRPVCARAPFGFPDPAAS